MALILVAGCGPQTQPEWPDVTKQNRPWTRWWWMGSSVNKKDLARNLEMLKDVNLGGVEITPIYGVSGYEEQFIDYLSPQWMDMLEYTLQKSDSLGLGVDMATGTGWPFGGPWVREADASKNVRYKTYKVKGGDQLNEKIAYTQEPMVSAVGNQIYEIHNFLKGEKPSGTAENPLQRRGTEPLSIDDIKEPIADNDNLQALALAQVRFRKQLPLQALVAYSKDGTALDLTDKVSPDGTLDWTAPEGAWTLYAVFQGWHGKIVERAAPGGEGFAPDHFSKKAIHDYLDHFNKAFEGHDISFLRAFFNDSYEVDDASGEAAWTPRLLEEFETRRGYDLRDHLPALFGNDSAEMNGRVISDFRETISDLLLDDFTKQWDAWADSNKAIVRDQAHGSPANILDLYAATDIPETEGTDILRAKMASSAAHVTGKSLVSSESATWLNEHFQSSLSEVKTAVDRYFISGVNHIFYHGSAYSPQDAKWPGWLFYAAVHFQPVNPFWDHFGAFNKYVARVQSFLQTGKSDNDVLLYYPIYDQWAQPGRALLEHFDGGIDEQFDGTAFKEAADWMHDQGYTFDFISDRQVAQTSVEDGEIATGGTVYQTVVVPAVNYMPLETLQQLLKLAHKGSTVIMFKGKPQGVPGLGNLEEGQTRFKELMAIFKFSDGDGIKTAEIGDGRILLGNDLGELLSETSTRREIMVDEGLRFARRSADDGDIYFITNWGDFAVDEWISLGRKTTSAALYNPMNGEAGYAKVKSGESGETQVYIQMEPGESRILKTYTSAHYDPTYNYVEKSGAPVTLHGNWSVHFENGGPELPADVQVDSLTSWTDFGGPAVKNFSGTARYTLRFPAPDSSGEGWLLNLGNVHESANIAVNGHDLGTVIGPVYQVFVPDSIINEQNSLSVEVSNLMANRIAYMDRNNISWKKFYNVNFPARLKETRDKRGLFDASRWSPQDSGLMGPVILTPVKRMR